MAESMKAVFRQAASSSARANLKTIRACSMLAAHRTDSLPGLNKGSAGFKNALDKVCSQPGFAVASRQTQSTARWVRGAVAAAMNAGLERFKVHDLHRADPER